MTTQRPKPRGLLAFGIAMGSGFVSLTGTQMVQLALIIWAWDQTRSTTATGLITVASFVSVIAASIFAGALVDRWRRKYIILATDALGLVGTLVILILFRSHQFTLWHVIGLEVLLGVLEAFQSPAYLASVTEMVEEGQRTRANALYQLSWSLSTIVSASVAGFLIVGIGVAGVLAVDVASYLVILAVIAVLHIPQPVPSDGAPRTSLMRDIVDGFRYLRTHPYFLATLLVFTSVNVAYGAYLGVFRPMVLALTHNDTATLGLALAAVGVGSVVGGLVMTAWKVRGDRVPPMLLGWSVMSLFAFIVAGFGRSLVVWGIAGFFQGVFNDVALALTFSIWQDKVESSYQGRVFGIVRLVVQGSIPVAVFLTSLLSDGVLEPAMRPGSPLVRALGWALGSGPGTGMALGLILIGALFGVAVPLLGFAIPLIRDADRAVGGGERLAGQATEALSLVEGK